MRADDPVGLDEFATHRSLLFSIAYEILGSVTDAEDVLSESWLRWQDGDRSEVENPRAYLARIVTRQALNAARSASRRRETYVGPWLPEPLEEAADGDGLDHVLTGEAVTTAMLLVLEALTPDERAVFVLREVFDFGYPEIADAVDKTPAAVRQIAHRARNHVRARRPATVANPADARAVADRFLLAAATGEVQALMDLLAPGVVFVGDGGGVVSASRRPVEGAATVARLVVGLLGKAAELGEVGLRMTVANGMPAAVVSIDGVVDNITCVEVCDGAVTAVYAIRNPAKLDGVRLNSTGPAPDGSSP
ncbi:RNA polymerase sigma-70 factor [Gordonia sp. (in: high G+C Gram-positive bacteria)]|uniref:RNA polymerase sigma-70 factor n=1 Tax=Gordonia sp. (in: high G+C Gram-positive bacteria) TaxID=84139 RepID=UPI00169A54AF|nr:RNA polymerase sigma-70 factor [Gordonia sp. (in: high G+C Gram-positive bacteria)]NLG45235.1 RNA polymerase sigma-70 factor [Gordonia sp. (in: high G+C Gram-positive bacteria)]